MMFSPYCFMFLKQQSRGDFAQPPPTSDQVFISTGLSRIDPGMSLTVPEVEVPQ
jgi:hypothetical protein